MKPTQEQVIAWAREAGGWKQWEARVMTPKVLEAFAALADEAGRTAEREKVAAWMIQRSYATGHGDTTEDLLAELDWQIAENWNRAMINGIAEGRKDENEACAKVAESYEPRCDSCPSGVANAIRARREQ